MLQKTVLKLDETSLSLYQQHLELTLCVEDTGGQSRFRPAFGFSNFTSGLIIQALLACS